MKKATMMEKTENIPNHETIDIFVMKSVGRVKQQLITSHSLIPATEEIYKTSYRSFKI